MNQGPPKGDDGGKRILECDSVVVGCGFNDSSGIYIPPVFPIHHHDPAWSRQGLIAYEDAGIVCVDSCGGASIDRSLAGIWILDPQTGEKRWLTPGSLPSWSPEGTKIAFVYGQIHTINVDGTGLVQVTTSGRSFYPAWSPDGESIAYDSNAGGFYQVWVMGIDGTNKRNISQQEAGRMPNWRYDGARIAHIRYREVYTMNVDGSNPIRVTDNNADDREPAYSPDGQWIAFASQSRGLPEIWIVRTDGTEARQLTSHGGSHPSWSPDGTKIVFTRQNWWCNIPANGVLWIVNVSTGEESQLTFKWPERCGSSRYTVRQQRPARPVTHPTLGSGSKLEGWNHERIPSRQGSRTGVSADGSTQGK